MKSPAPPWVLALTALGLLALGGCDQKSDGDEKKASRERSLLVRTTQPTRRTLDRTLEITAEIGPLLVTTVQARTGGLEILEMKVDVGDVVQRGQILTVLEDGALQEMVRERKLAARVATIDERDAEIAVRTLKAERLAHQVTMAQKKRALDRAEAQVLKGAIAAEVVDNAKYEHDTELAKNHQLGLQIEKAEVARDKAKEAVLRAALDLERAQREATYARVTAPFDGIVSARIASPGQISTPNMELVRIFDPKSLVVEAHVPQQALHQIREGLRVRVKSDALPGTSLEGSVALVAPIVDEEGTIMVRLALDRRDQLKPGLFVSGEIVLETRQDTLTVPRKAVGYERERPFIYRVVEDRSKTPVTDSDGEIATESAPPSAEKQTWKVQRVWFREGLSASDAVEFIAHAEIDRIGTDDRIVLVGLDRLRDGDTVRIEGEGEGDFEVASEVEAGTPASSGGGK